MQLMCLLVGNNKNKKETRPSCTLNNKNACLDVKNNSLNKNDPGGGTRNTEAICKAR